MKNELYLLLTLLYLLIVETPFANDKNNQIIMGEFDFGISNVSNYTPPYTGTDKLTFVSAGFEGGYQGYKNTFIGLEYIETDELDETNLLLGGSLHNKSNFCSINARKKFIFVQSC